MGQDLPRPGQLILDFQVVSVCSKAFTEYSVLCSANYSVLMLIIVVELANSVQALTAA